MFKWTDFSIVKLFVIKTFPFLKPVKKRNANDIKPNDIAFSDVTQHASLR